MPAYKTPGVYLEEAAKLPPSVAEATAAIPAFIGYTQISNKDAGGVHPVLVRSLMEYEAIFGTKTPELITMFIGDTTDINGTLTSRVIDTSCAHDAHWNTMYYHLQLYFANGGGPCYILSVGIANNTLDKADLQLGIDTISSMDNNLIIVIPECVNLTNSDIENIFSSETASWAYSYNKYRRDTAAARYDAAINNLMAAMAVLDSKTQALAAAQAVIDAIHLPDTPTQQQLDDLALAQDEVDAATQVYAQVDVTANSAGMTAAAMETLVDNMAANIASFNTDMTAAVTAYGGADMYDLYDNALQACSKQKKHFLLTDCYNNDAATLRDAANGIGMNNLSYGAAYHPFLHTNIKPVYNESMVNIRYYVNGSPKPPFQNALLSDIKTSIAPDASRIYLLAKDYISQLTLTLPPCSAIAAVYASTDRTRGIWKAPANVGLSRVTGTTVEINDEDQALLNIDPVAGKSINAIRNFAGKGTLVWGARTLAGNSNEWRYVSVRRLFSMAETSIRNALENFVFENNDANTWTKIQAMIENYLTDLWRQGALQGAKPEQAFYVAVGLGRTMTAQDVLEGRLAVEIGMAAVRPAEFIILRFSHMMATS